MARWLEIVLEKVVVAKCGEVEAILEKAYRWPARLQACAVG